MKVGLTVKIRTACIEESTHGPHRLPWDGGGDWVEGWGELGGLQGGACGGMRAVHLAYTPVCQIECGEKDCLGLTLSPGETDKKDVT